MASRGRLLVQLACASSEKTDESEFVVINYDNTNSDLDLHENESNNNNELANSDLDSHESESILNEPANIFLDVSSDTSSYRPEPNSSSSDSESDSQAEDSQPHITDTDNVNRNTNKRKRNRVAQPSKKRNKMMNLRKSGQEYINRSGKTVPKKTVKNTDCSKCRFKCNEHFSDDLRKKICEEYWALNNTIRQKQYLSSLVTISEVVRRKQDAAKQRSVSKQYHLIAPGGMLTSCCMKFLCDTLSISHRVLDTLEVSETGVYTGNDKRKGKKPPNATPMDKISSVKSHIDSFPRMESHYCRRDSKKLYLSSELNISIMYRLYVEEMKKVDIVPVSHFVYKNIFNSYEPPLSFYKPKKYQCSKCNAYNASTNKSDLKDDWEAHKKREKSSMEMKNSDKLKAVQDKGESFRSISFDLQSILTLPFAGDSAIYYKRKFNAYNFTIFENHSKNEYCYIWDECNGQKGSNEISSSVLKYLFSLPDTVTHVSSFSDTCGGQNRNKNICAAMLYAVNKVSHLEIIDLKYMESGHSYLEADGIHATIERARTHKKKYTTREWALLVSAARLNPRPYIVHVLDHSDFYDIKSLAKLIVQNSTKNTAKECVNWLKIKWLRFIKSKPNMILYKYDLEEDSFMEIDIYQKRNAKEYDWEELTLSNAYPGLLPITAAKKKDLLSLLQTQVIPKDYEAFYNSLPSTTRAVRVDSSDEE